ncbi:universal stress protein, partial [Saccharothrix hoggarensis]
MSRVGQDRRGGRPRIVVGFDGSPNSVVALDWALGEAGLRDARVVLCHVHEAGGEEAAWDVLGLGVEHAGRREPRVAVTGALVAGNPARHLVRSAADALLLVVGARGSGGYHGLRLGSVSDQVARHARRAFAVVLGRDQALEGQPDAAD